MKNTQDSLAGTRKTSSSRIVDSVLIQKVKEAINIPDAYKDRFWELEPVGVDQKDKKKILGVFGRRSLKEDEAKELRKAVVQSPGNTRVKIDRLRKKYPDNGLLLMFSAMCTYGMVLNSSNKDEALDGFKSAVKEAATALLSDQISLYNMEMFFKIYFAYLERYKRFQVNVYEEMLRDPRLESTKREFLNAIQIGEQFFSEKNGIQKIINRLKKKMKSSMYISNIDFMLIKETAHQIINGNSAEKSKLGTASETIAYIHAVASAFARIPVLFPVVDKILSQLPEMHKAFLLRKISINTTRNFVRFRMAAAEGEKEVMAKIGKTIIKENTFAMAKLEGQSLYQPYETDPFFNLVSLAELSHGLYSDTDHQDIVDSAIEAMDAVISRDMSKNHIFTETATKLSHKLSILKTSFTPAEEVTAQTPLPDQRKPNDAKAYPLNGQKTN